MMETSIPNMPGAKPTQVALEIIRRSRRMTEKEFDYISNEYGPLDRLHTEKQYIWGRHFTAFLEWLPRRLLIGINVALTYIVIAMATGLAIHTAHGIIKVLS